jgi:hypothetical protein
VLFEVRSEFAGLPRLHPQACCRCSGIEVDEPSAQNAGRDFDDNVIARHDADRLGHLLSHEQDSRDGRHGQWNARPTVAVGRGLHE